MRYSEQFERDFQWLLSMRHIFDFDGKGLAVIPFDKNGVTGKEAFRRYDSQGKIVPTRHPNIVQSLIRTKGSANLHVKQYAQGAVEGTIPHAEVREYLRLFGAPEWVFRAVDNQWRKMFKKERGNEA